MYHNITAEQLHMIDTHKQLIWAIKATIYKKQLQFIKLQKEYTLHLATIIITTNKIVGNNSTIFKDYKMKKLKCENTLNGML